jgi:LPS sulfotransferase NodH
MTRRFDAFVMFAEMRTGSNYLEASLGALPDLACHGEVYNPTFMGNHTTFQMFGYDMDRREADPLGLLDAMIAQSDGVPGFRLFHDHDDRVVERVLPDPRIAKIILTRNPLESYVSRKIATATGQWRLNDLKHHRSARARFDMAEFADLMDRLQAFQLRLQRGLQTTGQTAFYVRYDDINDVDVLNGLAAYLGSDHRLDAASDKLKKQNPGDLSDKVENYDDMVTALARFDRFDLGQTPNFEPPRHAGVTGYVAHPSAGLLFIPVRGGPDASVRSWMGRIGDVGEDALLTRLSQKDLRQWMKAHPGYRSFTVLRHPVARAYHVFNHYILPGNRPAYADPRQVMRKRYGVTIPANGADAGHDATTHRDAFHGFLTFLKGNLAGQTSIRIDPAWATQTAILQGAANFILPHRIVFEDDMAEDLPMLATEAGVNADVPANDPISAPFPLKEIYDGKIEQAAIDTYRRDYLSFGFPRWNRR